MIFKGDWDECKHRFDAFWRGEIVDRACIAVLSPRDHPLPAGPKPVAPVGLEARWTDETAILPLLVHGCHDAWFGGESFPSFFPNLGPGVLSAFLGNPYRLAEDTVWFDQDPMLLMWEDAAGLALRRDNPMWRAAERITAYYSERARGDWVVAMTDLGGGLDVAAALRGTQTLLTDLYDHPGEVRKLTAAINAVWFQCYDELVELIHAGCEGMSTWLPLWCRDHYYTLQSDFAAMISPRQFDVFVRPGLEEQAACLDHTIYHLDGPGQLAHLESLLSMERLTGIQWVPGAGAPDETSERWMPVYRRIQEKGKRLFLSIHDPRAIRGLVEELSPEGLFLTTTAATECEARRLVDDVKRWSMREGRSMDVLALKGGKPVRTAPFPTRMLGASLISNEELAELADVVREKTPFRHYGIGTPGKAEAFEREARRLLDTRYVLGVSSGTGALVCAVAALGLGPGDEVILPAFSWYSDYNAIVAAGALPVFADIDESLNLDPADFERKLTPRTRAVIVVHYQGGAADMDRILAVSSRAGVRVLEDCAQAFGGSYHGRRLGSLGDIAVASFQANKMITAGEGGLVWTTDQRLFARAVRHHDLGFVRPVFAAQLEDASLAREVDAWAGCQYRMSELTGAFLLAQIRKLGGILETCGAHHRALRQALAGSTRFKLRPTGEDDCGITLYLRFPGAAQAKSFSEALAAEGIPLGPSSGCAVLPDAVPISTRAMVRPDLPPFGKGYGGEHVVFDTAKSCPRTREILALSVAVGIGPLYREDDVADILRAIRKVERLL